MTKDELNKLKEIAQHFEKMAASNLKEGSDMRFSYIHRSRNLGKRAAYEASASILNKLIKELNEEKGGK